jgi:hypothetical protein
MSAGTGAAAAELRLQPHIADAAEATVAAVEHGERGVYNVVADDPAPVAEWLPRWRGRWAQRSPGACLRSSCGCSPVRSP